MAPRPIVLTFLIKFGRVHLVSCEQLVTNLQSRKTQLPRNNRERVELGYFIQNLSLTCKESRSRTTHTSKLVNPVDESGMDGIWERTRQQAQAYLNSRGTAL